MKISSTLKERFCRDLQLPIKIFQEPYFTERLELYDKHFGCLDAYTAFCEMLQNYDSEQEYLAEYNGLKDAVIQHLQNCPEFVYFCEKEDMSKFDIPNRSFPKNSIYKQTLIGKRFVSFDMCKGNFTAIKHYNPNIFNYAETYEDFIRQFTDNEHFIKSKYIRQVIFGAVNPKRQVKYEQYLMNKVLEHILNFFAPEKIVYFSTDEIVVELSNDASTPIDIDSEEYKFIADTVNMFVDMGITIRGEAFVLSYMEEYDAYIKKVYAKVFASDGRPLSNSELQVIKNATNLTMPFVIRKLYNLPASENDNVFIYEGRLAKFI